MHLHSCVNHGLFYFFRNSASCTHISALLHALVLLTAPQFSLHPADSGQCIEEEAVPVTSLPCLWKPPKKRKESTMQMSEATFTKDKEEKTEAARIF